LLQNTRAQKRGKMNLIELLQNNFKRYSKNVCFYDPKLNYYTYSDILNEVQNISTYLLNTNAQVVGILSQKSIQTYTSLLACLYQKSTFFPINSQLPNQRLSDLISLECLNVVIYDPEYFSGLFKGSSWNLHEINILGKKMGLAQRRPSPKPLPYSNIAYLIQTSGSTGKPKTICISRDNLYSFIQNTSPILNLSENDKIAQTYDLCFDPAIGDIILSHCAGASLAPFDFKNNLDIKNYLKLSNINIWNSTPTVANAILRLLPEGYHNENLRLTSFIGEKLTLKTVHEWQNKFRNSHIFNLYGPAETTIAISYYLYKKQAPMKDSIAIGHIFPDHQYKITKEQELHISGPQVSPGYLDNTQTEKRFYSENSSFWYRTGDRVEQTDEGLYFLGRTDRQLKINGIRVESEDLEGLIFDAIGKTATVFCEKTSQGDYLYALVHEKTSQEEIDKLSKRMSERHPSSIRFFKVLSVERILNQSGKIDHAKIIEKFYE